MPVKDGRMATQELREREEYRNIPIIAFTAHVLPEEERKYLLRTFGFSDFLIKPVSSIEVKKLFNKLWNE